VIFVEQGNELTDAAELQLYRNLLPEEKAALRERAFAEPLKKKK
jgi:hypothetical protein